MTKTPSTLEPRLPAAYLVADPEISPFDRDPKAWVVPAAATVLLFLLLPAAGLFCFGMAMSTDPCGPGECQALNSWLGVAVPSLFAAYFFSPGVCIAAWVLPWKRRWAGLRRGLALLAMIPPAFVIFLAIAAPAPTP